MSKEIYEKIGINLWFRKKHIRKPVSVSELLCSLTVSSSTIIVLIVTIAWNNFTFLSIVVMSCIPCRQGYRLLELPVQ